ncbi:MAG: leucine-rich repeat protein, partial [Kiritimatiellae bacterium]|nr:leucine-rich repeat protein [Kiritimatiellia bacterium]
MIYSPSGLISGGIYAINGETIDLYAIWEAHSLYFDATGGNVSPASKSVTLGDAYGELPLPEHDGYVFLDWRLDGAAVDAETIVTTVSNHVLSARWGVSIGGGVWEETICDEPISLGAPLVAPSGEVVIPAEIDGRPVVAIGAEAFAGNTAITSITIPASVTNIAEGAFAGCTGLNTVSISEVKPDQQLSDFVSGAETHVEKVVFLDGVTIIPDNFFEGCTALRTMDLAESVAEIGTNVFEACSALATTTLENGLRVYQGWVLGFAGGSLGELAPPDLAIPEEYEDVTARPEGSPHHGTPYRVRGIAAGAFKGEYGIATLSLPESLAFIGAEAFEDCTGLGSVTVPEGVAKIDRDAFRNCTRAQGLALPESLRVVADGAFANGTRLQSVSIPQGVEEIGGCAFSNCWRVTSVSIPQSVERIGDGAFADCENVAGAVVPLHVRPMAELFPAAYATMTDAWVAELDGSLGELAPPEAEGGSPGGLAPPFETRQMVPGMFAGCAAVEAIALPEWVRNVPDGAFEGCAAISALTFPGSVTNLGARACASMAALESVTFPAALETIGEEAFDGDSGIVSLALPDGLLSIGERAFRGLSRLARADIPASVREIGADAFAGCAAIRAISMPGDAGTVADAFPDAYASIVSATVVA